MIHIVYSQTRLSGKSEGNCTNRGTTRYCEAGIPG